jgi:hypothetical protein
MSIKHSSLTAIQTLQRWTTDTSRRLADVGCSIPRFAEVAN